MRARLVLAVVLAVCCIAAATALAGEEQQQQRLRVLEATLQATARNPADYTAWQARRSALLAPETDAPSLEMELHTAAATAVIRAPKCFQTWHHRRCVLARLVSLLPPTPLEGKARDVLRAELAWAWARLAGEGEGEGGADPKNVHAWAYHRWVLERAVEAEGGSAAAAIALLQEEMRKAQALLEDGDWDNNSAWCYRHGLLRRLLALGPPGGEGADAWAFRLCKAELLFTTKLLRRDPDNASAWAHLRGLLSPTLLPYPTTATVHRRLHPLVTEAAAAYIARKSPGGGGEGWLLARDLLVDLQLPPLCSKPTLLRLVRAKRLVERTLEENVPVMAVRRGYWEWKLARMQAAIDAKRAAMRVEMESSRGRAPLREHK